MLTNNAERAAHPGGNDCRAVQSHMRSAQPTHAPWLAFVAVLRDRSAVNLGDAGAGVEEHMLLHKCLLLPGGAPIWLPPRFAHVLHCLAMDALRPGRY